MKKRFKKTPRPNPFTVSFLQVRRGYKAHFGRPLPSGITYQAAAEEIVVAMGYEAAREFLMSVSRLLDHIPGLDD